VAGEGKWKIVLSRVDRKRIADIRDEISEAFSIGQSQSNDIVNNVPIILIDGLTSEDQGNLIKGRLSNIIAFGGEIAITDEDLVHTLKLTWPETPRIARTGSYQPKAELEEYEQEEMTIAKYNFIINEELIFACPSCGEAYLLKLLSPEEKEEAMAQAEIHRLLKARKKKESETLSTVGDAPAAPDDIELLKASSEGLDELVEGREAKKDEDLMDFAAFEKGLDKLETGKAKAKPASRRRPAPRPIEVNDDEVENIDLGPLDEKESQKIFSELDELPETKEKLKPIPPEEAVKELEKESGRKPKPATEPVPEITEFVEVEKGKPKQAPEPQKRPAPRMEPVQTSKPKTSATKPEQVAGKKPAKAAEKKPVPQAEKKPAEAAEKKPEPQTDLQEEGFFSLVLSKIVAKNKKEKAAEIIAEVQGIDVDEAYGFTDKIICTVVSGVSKGAAEALQKRFKEMGIASRVTEQKGKKRRSERLAQPSD
jgi:ribosomal protein L7/L12